MFSGPKEKECPAGPGSAWARPGRRLMISLLANNQRASWGAKAPLRKHAGWFRGWVTLTCRLALLSKFSGRGLTVSSHLPTQSPLGPHCDTLASLTSCTLLSGSRGSCMCPSQGLAKAHGEKSSLVPGRDTFLTGLIGPQNPQCISLRERCLSGVLLGQCYPPAKAWGPESPIWLTSASAASNPVGYW